MEHERKKPLEVNFLEKYAIAVRRLEKHLFSLHFSKLHRHSFGRWESTQKGPWPKKKLHQSLYGLGLSGLGGGQCGGMVSQSRTWHDPGGSGNPHVEMLVANEKFIYLNNNSTRITKHKNID